MREQPIFKKGDRVRYRSSIGFPNRLGVVIGVERLHRNYRVKWDRGDETWCWEAELDGPFAEEVKS